MRALVALAVALLAAGCPPSAQALLEAGDKQIEAGSQDAARAADATGTLPEQITALRALLAEARTAGARRGEMTVCAILGVRSSPRANPSRPSRS